MSTNQPWANTKDKWIDKTELNIIIGVVNSVKADVNCQGFRSWICWNLSDDILSISHITINNNFISIFVCESDLDVLAIAVWAFEVVTTNFNFLFGWVLGLTICWIDRCDSWTIKESNLLLDVLPLLSINTNFNGSLFADRGLGSNAFVLGVCQFSHNNFSSNDTTTTVQESTFNFNIFIR